MSDKSKNSAYLAEYYDLQAKADVKTLNAQDDAKIYLSALKKQVESYYPLDHHGEHLVVLDVCTGTGRVLANLATDGVRDNIPLSNVEFIGVDKEPSMIHRALAVQQETPSMSHVGRIDWLVGEALHLISAELLETHINQVDLLLSAAGSVSLLTRPGELLRFLAQAAALLRPRSGRFYLSVRRDLLSTQSTTDPMSENATYTGLCERREFPSGLYENIVYRQLPIGSPTVEGSIKKTPYQLQVIKWTKADHEEVIEESHIESVQKIWEEPELLKCSKEAGLEFVETIHTLHETYYVLKQAG
ncbi:hypothetical protein BDV27DRAFT_119018 [Aspergillus caelatus]|uniref:Methyltransferase domain-containing protein n=1 Tax=Aspergillus caelatus TaxID=61420 RepID=A0A5N7ALH6_9EURO|nr:uncharacterized protein BDV27DRAFT_119018 [Aspergillus caelatus]KAE8370764.1 hypothetical protein BDV27DRAFT_119018 [Aspergillus caelatus]